MASERKSLTREIVDYAIAGAMLYLSLNPELIEKFEERSRELWRGVVHSFSVGQAVRAIRNLPETESTESTEIKGPE